MKHVIKPIELFILLVSLLSAFITLFTGLHVITGIIFILAIIIIIVFLWIISKRYYKYQILSTEDEIGVFRPPLEYDFDQIYLLDKSVFPPIDLIPKEIFLQWHRVNKNTFTVLCVGEKVIGYYSVLPIKQNALRKFLKGTISEIDLASKDILPEQEAQNSKEIYFFSIVVDKEYKHRGFQLLQHVVDELKTKTIYPQAQKVYATAATTGGRILLQKSGFVKIADLVKRKDLHDLYEYTFLQCPN